VQGLSADEYLRQSIREPGAFTVPGFSPGLMPPFTGLTDQQVNDLIAYLKTLE
jgi:cytochrome c1